MIHWWAEEWSFGSGVSRVSCGISKTPEGYAVDLFRGATCVESFVYPSREEAIQVAHGLKVQYRDAGISPPPAGGRSKSA